MKGSINIVIGSVAACLLAIGAIACTSVQETPKPAPPVVAEKTQPAKPAPAKTEQPKKQEAEKSATKQASKKAVEVEGVISSVGQRTITFQLERKGKVREEVVGVDDKTDIEKGGNKVKLRDLQETDKALINYEPEAYTPALAIKVTGKGELQKVGGDD
jgi:phage tail tape-measure protein